MSPTMWLHAQDELVQPICDHLVHHHVSQGRWERFATSVISLAEIKRHFMEAVGTALKGM